MEYIKEADARTKEKEEKDKKTELVKKEAVKETQIIRKKGKTKQIVTVTHLKNQTLTQKRYPLDHLGHMTRYCESWEGKLIKECVHTYFIEVMCKYELNNNRICRDI